VIGSSFGSAPPTAEPSTPRPQSDEEEVSPAPTPPATNAPEASTSPHEASHAEEADEEEDEYAEMDEFDVRLSTSELVASLCRESILVVPPIVWNSECGAQEELAIDRAGFLFSMYQVCQAPALALSRAHALCIAHIMSNEIFVILKKLCMACSAAWCELLKSLLGFWSCATHSTTLQHTATTAIHCNTLPYTNTLICGSGCFADNVGLWCEWYLACMFVRW